ncbi:ATP-binding cassette domain-containing protein [Robbsia sp. KACC 23696]|uniref:ABC transporter ATP-binding protein n=1 Tax=Robbsia sp. KACC 23696 TaxID=3149231 RepID=UPI00325BEB9C
MSDGLRLEGVIAGYSGKDILHGVSCEIAPRSSLAVVGPNGSGKSTLLKVVVGLIRPRQGRVWFDGIDMTGFTVHERVRHGIGYAPQEANVFRNLSVFENLKIAFEFGRSSSVSFRGRLDHVLALFPEIAEKLQTRAGELSGGQRQMVAMAAAMMPAPRYLVLDEPSAGLSPKNAVVLFDIIKRVVAEGVTLLMIEQNVRLGLACTTHGLLLVNGVVRLHQSAETLREDRNLQSLYFGVS